MLDYSINNSVFMEKKKIAFVVAAPMTATAFLMDHIAVLMRYYEVHLICNFPNDESKKPFEERGLKCRAVPILREISVGRDLKGLLALVKLFKREKYQCVHSVWRESVQYGRELFHVFVHGNPVYGAPEK